jgi:serine/threonine protein phosphatase 1
MNDKFKTIAIPRFSLNLVGRDFAVGDIHGSFKALQKSLAAIGFDPTGDRLFSVGDLVDRGPESHEVLTWLDKPWFNAICGNHDLMAWRRALGLPFPEVDHRFHGGEWLDELDSDVLKRIGQRLAALPLALEVQTPTGVVGLVHSDCPFDDWQDMQTINLNGLAKLGSQAGRCLWSADRHDFHYTGVIKSIQAVVHGHRTIPAMLKLGNAYFIDTGGWKRTGHFTFLNLTTLEPLRGPGPAISAVVPSRRNR